MKYRKTKDSLREHNLAPHKRFGQNFLTTPHTARAIVNCGDFDEQDTIIEVGVGLGALTNIIAERAGHVIGIEIDNGLIRYHQQQHILKDNVALIHDDVLKTDLHKLAEQAGQRLKIMANLPYSISNPFIFKLIENRTDIDWVVVMLQKEMAERLVASPSNKQYGIPSVLLGAYAKVEKQLIVRPHEFHPRPKVDSMVISISFAADPPLLETFTDSQHQLFQQIVRSAFATRRKTLLNNLSSLKAIAECCQDKKDIKAQVHILLENAGIAATERAENLTVADFATLTRSTTELLGKIRS